MIRNGDYTLTECFEENPEIRNKVNKVWENVTTVDTFFAKRNPTDEECEEQEREHAHQVLNSLETGFGSVYNKSVFPNSQRI